MGGMVPWEGFALSPFVSVNRLSCQCRTDRCAIRVRGPYDRHGHAVTLVAVSSALLIGFAALAVDVGYLYVVRAELQRTADAAAHAATQELESFADGHALDRARAAAQEFATRNGVLGRPSSLTASDVTFGRAYVASDGGSYTFERDERSPNAVRVRVRRTADSPNGPVPLFFAHIFGMRTTNVSATATAALTPRDIVFVLDLSSSHNDDSQLRSYRNTEIANRQVWEHLWDEALAASLGKARPVEGGLPAGPCLGNMNQWGTSTTGPDWNFAGDQGLVLLAKGSNWSLTSGWVSYTLNAHGYGTYTATEMSAINSSAQDGSTAAYQRRVLVALGIYRWKSGKSGGQPGGNGDNIIDASEVETMVPYPSSSSNPGTLCKQVGGSWESFVDYVAGSSSSMCRYDPARQLYGNPGLRYRFGLKTFVDYIQEKAVGDDVSPGLRGVPQQPMGAVADASLEMLNIIESLQSSDLVGIASYGTYGYGPAEKPDNMSWLTDDLDLLRAKIRSLQAGMWTSTTNMAQGIDRGVEVLLNSSAARPNAARYMILLTDGKPNQTRANPTEYYDELCQTCPPRADAMAAARDARNQGIRIYTVSVGANADKALMDAIAAIGGGEHLHAEGSVAVYGQQLRQIFRKLGGERPLQLIE